MLYSDHVKTGGGFLEIPSGVEFVVAVASDGLVSEKGFTAHVQEAYNRDIPLIAKLDVNIDIYGKDFSMANPLWPSFANDPHMKILKPFFDVCRIHAVMLDIRNSVGSEVWIPFVTKHLRELILNNFSVPVYILGDNELTTKYPAGAMDAFLSIEKMFCTYFPTASVNNGDTILEPNGSPKPNWNGVKFWWFGSQKFDFLSGTKSSYAPVLQYRSSKDILYKELGFVARNVVVVDGGNTEVPPPLDGGDEEGENYSSADIARIEEKLDDLIEYVKYHIR